MFGIITFNFIHRVNRFFTFINYKPTEFPDIDNVFNHVTSLIVHLIELRDIKYLINEYLFIRKKWNKVFKIFTKERSYNTYMFLQENPSEKLDTFDDNITSIILTNAFSKDKQFLIIDDDMDEDKVFTVTYEKKQFRVFTDSNLYLEQSGLHANIYQDKARLYEIKIKSNSRYIFQIDSKDSKFDIVDKNDTIYIYSKIDKSEDSYLADIIWDIMKLGKENKSVAVIGCYDQDVYELSILIAIAIILINKQYINRQKAIVAGAILN
jgi:hypothetical protein